MRKFLRGLIALFTLIRPRLWGPFLHAWERTRFDHDFSVSFSQGGEDLALWHLIGNPSGRYLDIGAHHPDRISNTRLLYDKGWSGVNVEANPNLVPALKKKRKRDVVISACVGTKPEYKFTVFKEPAISTSNVEWKERFISHNQEVANEITVQGVTLFELITKHFSNGDLDLLLVDAEGSDFEVIQSAEFQKLSKHLHPKWIVVETQRPLEAALRETTVLYLEKYGYEPHLVLPLSTILKRKN